VQAALAITDAPRRWRLQKPQQDVLNLGTAVFTKHKHRKRCYAAGKPFTYWRSVGTVSCTLPPGQVWRETPDTLPDAKIVYCQSRTLALFQCVDPQGAAETLVRDWELWAERDVFDEIESVYIVDE
jgi:hypothetical protein